MDLFRKDQVSAYGRECWDAGRRAGLEEAAKEVEVSQFRPVIGVAKAIRAKAEKHQPLPPLSRHGRQPHARRDVWGVRRHGEGQAMKVAIDTANWTHALRRLWFRLRGRQPRQDCCRDCGRGLTLAEYVYYHSTCERCEGINNARSGI